MKLKSALKLKQVFKIFFSAAAVNFFRLFRLFPNNDPIFGAMLPLSKENWKQSVLFVMLSMASFDILTGKIGIWTLVTSITYGFIAFAAGLILKKIRKINLGIYAMIGFFGIIFYDLITGPIMSSFVFKMNLIESFIGQMPFTIYHLSSGIIYIFLFCPVLDLDIDQRYNLVERLYRAVSNLSLHLIKFFRN